MQTQNPLKHPAGLLPVLLLAAIYFIATPGCHRKSAEKIIFPSPTEGEENEKLREKYEALRHRTAGKTDWRAVEAQNVQALQLQLSRKRMTFGFESFANDAISGEWQERGANNQTGSVRAIDYVPQTNTLYNISNGGSIWSSVLGSGAWVLRNQSARFEQRTIRAFTKTGGGTRLLVATNLNVYYSDNDGQTITPSTGITFPVEWAGNYVASIIRLNDATNTIYCLTRPWSNSPWGPRFWLYRSTNQGVNFTRIFEFGFGDDDRLSLCNPYNTNLLYAADIGTAAGSIRLHKITGTTVTTVNTFSTGITPASCLLKGTKVNNVLTMYTMLDNNSLYKTTNEGQQWQKQSNLPENAWMKMNVSPSNPAIVAFGGVNAFRSNTGGLSWTKINEWSDYYGDIANKLHADIMEIEFFKKTNSTEFSVINTHGGCYTSFDSLVTVSNQSLSSHLALEYYDVLTDTMHPNLVFTGTQDQGFQRTTTAGSPGIRDFSQVFGGDYGHLCLTGNNQYIWAEYPGGTFYLFTNPVASEPWYVTSWGLGGTQKPNAGWMLAAKATVDPAASEVWIGGGNTNGGGGSYLSKLTLSASAPFTVSANQLNYDFRANSNDGNSGISAIEQSVISAGRLYVATEDGTFFYSNNDGNSWTRANAFQGPGGWWLYGSCILASRTNLNTVWYAGSGYGNPPVNKSVDGGATFTPMSDGLPQTLVNEIAASTDERFLFAATEAGPYVYVAADNKWYSMASTNTPLQYYSSVEYIASENTVRFGTMGRGIFDFKIAAFNKLYTFNGNGNWDISTNWLNEKKPPALIADGEEIIVNPVADGEAVLNIPQQVGSGGRLSVKAGKKLRVTGNLDVKQPEVPPGAALNFNGVNNYVTITNNALLKPAAAISFQAWVKATDIHTTNYSEIYRKEDGNARHLFSFQEHGTILSLGLEIAGVYSELDVPVTAADFEGKWVQVTATYDGSAKKIYKDGVLIGTQNISGAIGTTGSATAYIGSFGTSGEFFNGSIDEFKIFSRALSAADIQSSLNCELGNQANGLILYYQFNEGAAGVLNAGVTTVTDAGPNNITGTLTNFNLNGTSSNWVAPGAVANNHICQ